MCAPEIGAICYLFSFIHRAPVWNFQIEDGIVGVCVQASVHFELASVDSKSLYLIFNFISCWNDTRLRHHIKPWHLPKPKPKPKPNKHKQLQSHSEISIPITFVYYRRKTEKASEWMKVKMYKANNKIDDIGKLCIVTHKQTNIHAHK